ncbi:hypothetical protein BDZ94DRAFT_1312843 [Collybia nuda]|uniref:DUF6533 domain-containing protein n=1 Tax=Collybia nuda TaxID=64659 RepID=A0A9P5XWC5_9AGAR|nr:hypothetical protein BDZ94DRAFT_1312843 [Collybia nuda]
MSGTVPSGPLNLQLLEEAAVHLQAGKYFQIAAFVVLIFDHLLTFSEEVERIWKRKITGAAILFLINRYITPLQFIITIDAFNDPIWTPTFSRCRQFVAFEGASTVALIAVCELIMILRVYALYGRRRPILVLLMVLWTLQIILSSISMKLGFPVPLPAGLVGCIFTARSKLFPAVWVTPLITDSTIFFLTMWRTRDYIKRSNNTPTMRVFIRDGLLYFLVIFVANLMNTLTFFLAVDDLKAVGASFSQLITATMISRLVLNLRSSTELPSEDPTNTYIPRGPMKFMTRTIGNLGEDLEPFDYFSHCESDHIPMIDSHHSQDPRS